MREENNLHHAQDAAVIAMIDQKTIRAAALYDKYRSLAKFGDIQARIREAEEELAKNKGENIDLNSRTNKTTGEIFTPEDYLDWLKKVEKRNEKAVRFPEPYDGFREEVQGRVKDIINAENGAEHFAQWATKFYGEPVDDPNFVKKIHPIFTSRLRKKKITGSTNQDTVRSPIIWEKVDGIMEKTDNKKAKSPQRLQRKNIATLTVVDLQNSPIRQSDLQVYEALKTYITTRDELVKIRPKTDEEKADFAKKVAGNIPWKLDKNGQKTSRIKTIKVWTDTGKSKSGFYVNDGKAFVNNGAMTRIDLYKWRGEGKPPRKINYKVMPVYSYEIGRIKKPNAFFSDLDGEEDRIYAFEMQIWKNDYLEMLFDNGKSVQGYFYSFNTSSNNFTLTEHKSPKGGQKWFKDKQTYKSFDQTPGQALAIRKIGINALGDNFPTSFYKYPE